MATRYCRMPSMIALMGQQANITIATYEIRLCGEMGQLIFATAKQNDHQAVLHGCRLLDKYNEYNTAEVWQGLRLIQKI